MEQIFYPDFGTINISSYLQTILSVAGVLLGLAFAALTYVLQSGFQSFKYNRVTYLKLYIHFGKKLLYTLSYLVLLSIIRLYFLENQSLLLSIHIIFSIIFIKSLLDYRNQLGYIHTIFSTKFVPNTYGAFRRYFRFIKNLGFFSNVLLLIEILVFTTYPVIVSTLSEHSWKFNDTAIIISTGLFLLYSVFIISRFIPQFFTITITEYDNVVPTENNSNSEDSPNKNIDYEIEKQTLMEYLEAHNYKFTFENKFELARGSAFINLLINESSEAWFNINVNEPKGTVSEIRRAIEEFSKTFLILLSDSNSDINSFVLSFHITLDNTHRNIFIRSTRTELRTIIDKNNDSRMFMQQIKNKLFDDLFKDL